MNVTDLVLLLDASPGVNEGVDEVEVEGTVMPPVAGIGGEHLMRGQKKPGFCLRLRLRVRGSTKVMEEAGEVGIGVGARVRG